MQQGLETVLTAQGPAPHPALELVGQAAQGGLEVAQRYIQMREQSATADAQAEAAKAAYAADAAKAQARAAVQASHQQAQQLEAVTPAALEGVIEDEEGDADEGAVEVVEAPAERPDEKDILRVETELFGVAHKPVMELREAVANGMSVEEAAKSILEGINRVAQAKANVPAFQMWAEGELGQMVEVLIPDAQTSYKERLIAVLFDVRQKLIEQMQEEEG
jgi:multidrug efflux pump subunit AcrA (membrane-fusion protein)